MFNVGDRVKLIKSWGIQAGFEGTIMCFSNGASGVLCGVNYDEDVGGHNLNGCCEYGHGWYAPEDHFELISNISDITDEELEELWNG